MHLSDVGLTTVDEGTVTLVIRSNSSTAAFESLPGSVDTLMTYRVVGERAVRVAADSSRTVQLTADADFDREGPILLEANGVAAGTIRSAGDERSTPAPDSTTTTGDSPFALATLLVAVAGAALLARRE